MSMTLTSPAFESNGTIPLAHTADGINASPPLQWSDLPRGTRSLALICEDPDAPSGTFTHWVVNNLPPEAHELRQGALPKGAMEGLNSFGKLGYGGPSPPRGKPHHYHFHLYALDSELPLIGEFSAEGLKKELPGHVLAEADLVGLYQRA
jgi:Raf kinase inhibitor-like YbhB/YbcL family protein